MERLKKLIKQERCKAISEELRTKSFLKEKECFLDQARKITPLHLAAKKGKIASLSCLLREGCKEQARAKDRKGNLPVHLALRFALDSESQEYTIEELNEGLVLPLIRAAPDTINVRNNAGVSVRELLSEFDQLVLEKERRYNRRKDNTTNGPSSSRHSEWEERLSAEAEEEYMSSWGKFENDQDWNDSGTQETYDEWVERILRERAQKKRPPSPPPMKKPKWTEEDQKKFIEEESKKAEKRKQNKQEKRRRKIYSELQEGKIGLLTEFSSEELGKLILSELCCLKGDEKLKAFKELRRFWHPDKFVQKFGCRVSDDEKPEVIRLVTEVSQQINTFVM